MHTCPVALMNWRLSWDQPSIENTQNALTIGLINSTCLFRLLWYCPLLFGVLTRWLILSQNFKWKALMSSGWETRPSFRLWLVVFSVTSHYLNWCHLAANYLSPRYTNMIWETNCKIQVNWSKIQQYCFRNITCQMETICFGPNVLCLAPLGTVVIHMHMMLVAALVFYPHH